MKINKFENIKWKVGYHMEFNDFTAAQVRIARPTDKSEEVIDFYINGLGLKLIQKFKGNRGTKVLLLDCQMLVIT